MRKLSLEQRIKQNKPIEIWNVGTNFWFVYRKYQKPENEAKNPSARWYVRVYTPACPNGEFGDMYINKIIGPTVNKIYDENDPKLCDPDIIDSARSFNSDVRNPSIN